MSYKGHIVSNGISVGRKLPKSQDILGAEITDRISMSGRDESKENLSKEHPSEETHSLSIVAYKNCRIPLNTPKRS